MFHIAVSGCINKMCFLSLLLSVFPDISRQYYGSRAARSRRAAVHCALHPFITFQTSNNSQTQRERERRWRDDSYNLYVVCVKTTAWVSSIVKFCQRERVQSSLRLPRQHSRDIPALPGWRRTRSNCLADCWDTTLCRQRSVLKSVRQLLLLI